MKIEIQTADGKLIHHSLLPPLGWVPKILQHRGRMFGLIEQLEPKGAKCKFTDTKVGADNMLAATLHPNAGLLIYRETYAYDLRDDIGTEARQTSGFSADTSAGGERFSSQADLARALSTQANYGEALEGRAEGHAGGATDLVGGDPQTAA